MTIQLYGGPLTRAFIVEWYLMELEVSYDFLCLEMQRGEHLKPDFLAVNPMGRLPALVDGDFKLWESGAILLYLAEKYDRFPETLEAKAEIAQWVFFANATLIPGLFVPQNCDREAPRLLQPLSDILQLQPYLLDGGFSVVDVAVGAVIAYIPILLALDLSGFPKIVSEAIAHLNSIDFNTYPGIPEYLQRLGDRPALQKSIESLQTNVKKVR
ncbi:MAG: glutathione S-transferase [Okeania sp. SIO2H7]|nr:glutathione S-transferase [Okeania sp. SIO2H7]